MNCSEHSRYYYLFQILPCASTCSQFIIESYSELAIEYDEIVVWMEKHVHKFN